MDRRNFRIYVGHLQKDPNRRELESAFNRYGKIRDIEVKARYAFIVSLIIEL